MFVPTIMFVPTEKGWTRVYEISEADKSKLEKAFTYHAPKDDQNPRYEEIRNQAKLFGEMLTRNCPPGRELSLSITALENTVMWANASIARGE